jgi:hypothetical protein
MGNESEWEKQERIAIKQFGENKNAHCLDCGVKTRYFNQCEKCYTETIDKAKIYD